MFNQEYYATKDRNGDLSNFTRRSPSVGIIKKSIQLKGGNLAPIKSPKTFKSPIHLNKIPSQKFHRSNILTSKDSREEQKMSATNGFLKSKKPLKTLQLSPSNLLTPSEPTRNPNNRYSPTDSFSPTTQTFDNRKKRWSNTELIQSINQLIKQNSQSRSNIHKNIRENQRIKSSIKDQTRDVNLQKVINGYKCITKESPRESTLKHFRQVKSTDRQTIISRDLSSINNSKFRKSLEPLHLPSASPDSSPCTSPTSQTLTYSTLSRTGYIPIIPETGYKKKKNQDTYLTLKDFLGINNNYLFGVLDGHGANGEKVSGFLREAFPEGIKRAFQRDFVGGNVDSSMGYKTMTSWFSQKEKGMGKVESLSNLRFKERILEEGMDYGQQELK